MIRIDASVAGTVAASRALMAAMPQTTGAIYLGMWRAMAGGASVARGHASGRPGPRVITGDFRRGIFGDAETQGETVYGWVGSNAAQARRLELGFHGYDILGRFYNQPPYPYLEPSVEAIAKLAVDEIGKAIRDGIG